MGGGEESVWGVRPGNLRLRKKKERAFSKKT
jgi:hypothetical protein